VIIIAHRTTLAILISTTDQRDWPEVGTAVHLSACPGKTGNSYIVVASTGGAPQHPGWSRNILANPEVEV
jgi:hypothetical protein